MARSSTIPDLAREHAWSVLWQRLLQPLPDDGPAPEPGEHPNDETEDRGSEDEAA